MNRSFILLSFNIFHLI